MRSSRRRRYTEKKKTRTERDSVSPETKRRCNKQKLMSIRSSGIPPSYQDAPSAPNQLGRLALTVDSAHARAHSDFYHHWICPTGNPETKRIRFAAVIFVGNAAALIQSNTARDSLTSLLLCNSFVDVITLLHTVKIRRRKRATLTRYTLYGKMWRGDLCTYWSVRVPVISRV